MIVTGLVPWQGTVFPIDSNYSFVYRCKDSAWRLFGFFADLSRRAGNFVVLKITKPFWSCQGLPMDRYHSLHFVGAGLLWTLPMGWYLTYLVLDCGLKSFNLHHSHHSRGSTAQNAAERAATLEFWWLYASFGQVSVRSPTISPSSLFWLNLILHYLIHDYITVSNVPGQSCKLLILSLNCPRQIWHFSSL